jgi:hypothetical protein
MEQRDVMFNSGMVSLGLSLFLACATLVVVTGNLILAALASACISSVVVIFLGSMQLMGWSLGAPLWDSCLRFGRSTPFGLGVTPGPAFYTAYGRFHPGSCLLWPCSMCRRWEWLHLHTGGTSKTTWPPARHTPPSEPIRNMTAARELKEARPVHGRACLSRRPVILHGVECMFLKDGRSCSRSCSLSAACTVPVECAGMVECVGVAVMVGLAVDYIVHMSACIAHCGHTGRTAVETALRTVGMSVVSGAVTTIGAAVFLVPCEMAVFQQFGAPFACRAVLPLKAWWPPVRTTRWAVGPAFTWPLARRGI